MFDKLFKKKAPKEYIDFKEIFYPENHREFSYVWGKLEEIEGRVFLHSNPSATKFFATTEQEHHIELEGI